VILTIDDIVLATSSGSVREFPVVTDWVSQSEILHPPLKA